MTYKINKTDGSLITEVIDSAIDQTATDITLIGKNVSGYGKFINENFVKILENFANTSQPNNPLAGQLWFDTSENRLKVYDGLGFKNGSGPVVSGTAPSTAIQGDFWIDSAENQLHFYTGSNRVLAGPIYKSSQGLSGFEVDTIYDTNNAPRVIVKLWVAQTLLGIFSKDPIPFTPRDGTPGLGGFTGEIGPGFNQSTLSGQKFRVTSSAADALRDGNVLKPASSFVSTLGNSTISTDLDTGFGTLSIQNDQPLKLGAYSETDFRVTPDSFQIVCNGITGIIQNFLLKVKNSSGTIVDALLVNSQDSKVGVFNNNPAYTLDVTGGFRASTQLQLPKYTTADRDARSMTSGNNGELIYNTTTDKIQAYAAGAWVDLN
jgi:hypothetical protein